MKVIFSLGLLLGFNSLLLAQDFIWGAEFEGGTSWIHSIAIDDAGNAYTAVTYLDEVDFDPGDGEHILDGEEEGATTLQKLDVNGNLEWVRTFENVVVDGIIGNNMIVQDIKIGRNDALFLTGRFSGSIDFDPGPGMAVRDAGIANSDIFVLRLDHLGNYGWVHTFGGDCYDEAKALTIDQAGNICVTGVFCQTVDFDPGAGVYELESTGTMDEGDLFILKLNENGDFIWAKSIESIGYEEAYDIVSDSDNNYYVGGDFSLEADFDCGEDEHIVSTTGVKDAFLLKMNESGDFVWVKTIEGGDYATVTSMDFDSEENLYITGNFNGDNIDLDLGDGVYEMNAAFDIFIIKLDDSDEFQWAKQLGGDGYDRNATIEISAINTIYIAGMYADEIDVDPGDDTYILTHDDSETGTNYDFFLTTLNADGEFINALGFTGNRSDYCRSLKTGPEGSIYMSGDVQSGVDLDPSADEFIVEGAIYEGTGYILKLQDGVLSIDERPTSSNFTLYPNPTTSQFNILLEENQAEVTVEIMDLTGRIIEQYADKNTAFIQMELDAPKGVYFVRVSTPAGKRVVKLIKN